MRQPILPVLLGLLIGCTQFQLANQSGVLPVPKQHRALPATLRIDAFGAGPRVSLSARDLSHWQQLLATGLDQANIVESVYPATAVPPDARPDFAVGGLIERFRFHQNWVPTFFPVHLGASFFSFTLYTLFGGPTNATHVTFTVDVELRSLETGAVLSRFTESYSSNRVTNVYTQGGSNPYENPNLVFGEVVDAIATRVAADLTAARALGP